MPALTQSSVAIKIAGGAVFSAISVVLSILFSPIVPRVPGWGIALIDPVSIIWVLCFLIFGVLAGLLCSTVGFIALFYVDPFVPWGPIFKLLATLPLIIIPYLLLKVRFHSEDSCISLGCGFKKPSTYVMAAIPAIIVRCVVMGLVNILFFIYILGEGAIIAVGGLQTIVIVAVAINAEQSIWDLSIPWLITYPTGIYQLHKLW